MIICPDCHRPLEQNRCACQACTWQYKEQDNIPIYLSTHDKNDELFKRYLDNYNEISVDDLTQSIQDSAYLNSQNEKLFSYLPPLRGLRVCEIGVGQGILLSHIRNEKPAELVGVDISIPYLKAIQAASYQSINLIVANAENLPFSNAFDVIIAADIIEHVFNVGDFLASVNRALKPGGHFVVKTPNNEDINNYSKLRGCKYNFVHLRNFNKQTLKTVLNGAGFEIKKMVYDGFYPSQKRKFIKNSSFLNKRCDNYFNKTFANVHEVNKINNFLGKILMNPIEVTVLSTKVSDCFA